MSRPRLTRSVPFWILIAGSLASAASGALLIVAKLGGMDARLTDGTATTNDVYVGQIWAILGIVLLGAGLIGLALALTVGALRSFVPRTPAAVTETETVDEPVIEPSTDTNGYNVDLGYSSRSNGAAAAPAAPITATDDEALTRS